MKSRLFSKLILTSILLVGIVSTVLGQRSYPPEIEADRVEVYKTIGDVEMRLWIKNPPGHTAKHRAPVIVFYFGGGWNSGSPSQFVEHADWLAGRGMVAVLADYRVFSRHNVPARFCVQDAKSAIRYLRKHAELLGMDPDRIVASGGSAGGHLAAAVATLTGHDDPKDDLSISAKPNALALFNPAVVLAPVKDIPELDQEKMIELKQQMDAELESISPYHNLKKGVVPTIIFHGTDDSSVPFSTVSAFRKKMKSLGNHCELVGYKGAGHGFFNSGRNNNIYFLDTMNRLDAFLISLGYIDAMPPLDHLN